VAENGGMNGNYTQTAMQGIETNGSRKQIVMAISTSRIYILIITSFAIYLTVNLFRWGWPNWSN